MPTPIDRHDLPTSFGAFKPVGHVMLGLPDEQAQQACLAELERQGHADGSAIAFSPRESVQEMQEMIDNASGVAAFGYEVELMRRYLALSIEGTRWVLVKVDDDDEGRRAAEIARRHGARIAVHYHRLTIEELL